MGFVSGLVTALGLWGIVGVAAELGRTEFLVSRGAWWRSFVGRGGIA